MGVDQFNLNSIAGRFAADLGLANSLCELVEGEYIIVQHGKHFDLAILRINNFGQSV